jgi:hypothetical protein
MQCVDLFEFVLQFRHALPAEITYIRLPILNNPFTICSHYKASALFHLHSLSMSWPWWHYQVKGIFSKSLRRVEAVASAGTVAAMPGLLDPETSMKLDIPDAAAVILDILSRETRCKKISWTMWEYKVWTFKTECCIYFLYLKCNSTCIFLTVST